MIIAKIKKQVKSVKDNEVQFDYLIPSMGKIKLCFTNNIIYIIMNSFMCIKLMISKHLEEETLIIELVTG